LEVIKESPNKAITEKKQNADDQSSDQRITDGGTKHDIFTETSRMQFLMLGLDLPPPPLFKDVMEKNIIPQVIMHYVLASLKILIT
jgi:U4/U6.U5 tri-snRNP-associated protein 2